MLPHGATLYEDNGYAPSHPSWRRLPQGPRVVRGSHDALADSGAEVLAGAVAASGNLLKEIDRGEELSRLHRQQLRPATADEVAIRRAREQHLQFREDISSGRDIAAVAPRAPAITARDLYEMLTATDVSASYPSGQSSTQGQSLSCEGSCKEGATRRNVSVRDVQRGMPVIPPAPTLPYANRDGLSPGLRKRAAVLADAARGSQAAPITRRDELHGRPPELADGVTTMLHGCHCDLGDLNTAPVSSAASFHTLLSKLVDTPEACFIGGVTRRYAQLAQNTTAVSVAASSPQAPSPGVSQSFSIRA